MKDRIRKLRKELDLTQSEFASKIGTSANVLTNYETGRRNPSSSVINNICKTFNINEEWLRDGTGEMFKASPSSVLDALAEEYGLSNAAYVMVEKFVSLKPEAQETIFNYVREVAAAFQSGEISPAAPAAPPADFSKLSVDEKVELYRQELEREEEAAAKSEVS
ncbi:MAG: helix-turn-helix domain-containing protein [Lachnospiraceae bacterium]|nr:helix-turn-helix domain-containing protein [Lachnospiraceae bacterium]